MLDRATYPVNKGENMRISDLCELLLLAAVWGSSFLFLRIASPVLGPVWLIELRVLLAGLALLPLLLCTRMLVDIRKKLVPLFIVGCMGSAVPFLLFAFVTLHLPAGFTAILNATVPLFGTVVAWIWLKEQLTFQRIAGFVLGFVGVVVLIGWKPIVTTPSFLLAVGAGLTASLLYAIVAPYTKKQLSDVPSLVTATSSQLSAAIFLMPALPFTAPTLPITPLVILVVVALALLSTALAYILYFRLIKNIGSTKTLTVAYLIPLFSMFWGALLLKEPVTISMISGCGLILLGTAIANGLLKITHI
jgi:drug/metabolite transporter (DMT)-like permease